MRSSSAATIALIALTACREQKPESGLEKITASTPETERPADHSPLHSTKRTERAHEIATAIRDGSVTESSALAGKNDVEAALDLLESPPSDQVELGRRLASAISDPGALSTDDKKRIAQAWQALHSAD